MLRCTAHYTYKKHECTERLIKKEYNVTNLWKYDLPSAWRLLYFIENQQIYVVSIVLEWMTHKEYERRFEY